VKTIAGTIAVGSGGSQNMLALDHSVVYGATSAGAFALRATDGRQLWSTPLSGGASSPTRVVDGVVYVAQATNEESPQQRIATIYALDANKGMIRWKHPTPSQNLNRLIVENGGVYAVSDISTPSQLELYAINADNGALRWQYAPIYGADTLTAADGEIYLGALSGIEALNAATGKILWRNSLGPADGQPPIVASGKVYFTAISITSGTDVALALDAREGTLLWQTALDSNAQTLTIAGDIVYVGGSSAYALSAGDGHVLWRYGSRAQFYQPVVSNGVVFIGSSDQNQEFGITLNPFDHQNFLNALDARTGQLDWRTSGSVENAPLVAVG
jgi:outer membrane protein assembly factor BamB